MNKLIEAFLSITRLESGKRPVSSTDFDLSETLSYIAGVAAPIALKKGITVVIEPPPGPFMVRLDQDLLVQCLLNLAENAVKYSPENRKITVKEAVAAMGARIAVKSRPGEGSTFTLAFPGEARVGKQDPESGTP